MSSRGQSIDQALYISLTLFPKPRLGCDSDRGTVPRSRRSRAGAGAGSAGNLSARACCFGRVLEVDRKNECSQSHGLGQSLARPGLAGGLAGGLALTRTDSEKISAASRNSDGLNNSGQLQQAGGHNQLPFEIVPNLICNRQFVQ